MRDAERFTFNGLTSEQCEHDEREAADQAVIDAGEREAQSTRESALLDILEDDNEYAAFVESVRRERGLS